MHFIPCTGLLSTSASTLLICLQIKLGSNWFSRFSIALTLFSKISKLRHKQSSLLTTIWLRCGTNLRYWMQSCNKPLRVYEQPQMRPWIARLTASPVICCTLASLCWNTELSSLWGPSPNASFRLASTSASSESETAAVGVRISPLRRRMEIMLTRDVIVAWNVSSHISRSYYILCYKLSQSINDNLNNLNVVISVNRERELE